MNDAKKEAWTKGHTLGLVVLTVAIGLVASRTPATVTSGRAPLNWYLVLLFLAAFIAVAGQGLTGRWMGSLIDSRNKMSLSRFQLLVWTVLILSAYLTVAIARIRSPLGLAGLDIGMPQELWWLMGISTASMVGSPLILSNKKISTPDPTIKTNSIRLMAANEGVDEEAIERHVDHVGSVPFNKEPRYARVADMFRGDETGTAAHLDLGKVQMFFFTVVLALGYYFALQTQFGELLKESAEFPPLNESMVALLGISHAGYLSLKAVPQSGQGGGGGGAGAPVLDGDLPAGTT